MKRGFTLVELLTVLAVITILVALILPSMSMARRIAKETKQKAQFATIGVGLEAFKKDFGDYPPSIGADYSGLPPIPRPSCGANKLATALLGYDLRGFHPATNWNTLSFDVVPYPESPTEQNLRKRKGCYIQLHTANAFKVGDNPATPEVEGLFQQIYGMDPESYVLCDVFAKKRVDITDPGPDNAYDTLDDMARSVKAGNPVLYYRANLSSKTITEPASFFDRIYDYRDNMGLLLAKEAADGPQPLSRRWSATAFRKLARCPLWSFLHLYQRPQNIKLPVAVSPGILFVNFRGHRRYIRHAGRY
ncbi:MAG: type II secretion system protein [Planctomycetota bacterium]|jgi:prepilin-type N-terminal cleavage/methylation domain-containing protein